MNNATHGCRGILPLFASVLLLGFPQGAKALPPDLTKVNPSTIDTTYTYNLGATGARGWIYSGDQIYGDPLHTPTWDSRQILVTAVASSTPATGILQVNDVILGAGTNGLFTDDARKSMGLAIGEAEKTENGGVLPLVVWRSGVTNNFSVTLPVMGSWSATVPYNCPKSSLVLSNAARWLAQQGIGTGEGANFTALALLATGDTNYLPAVRAYAYQIGTNINAVLGGTVTMTGTNADGTIMISSASAGSWGVGYATLFLTEYYLATGDTNVLPGINAYTIYLANGQSLYGTYGHGVLGTNADGSLHGAVPWYGPVNQTGVMCNMALALAKKCGVMYAELDPAITRASNFFSYYAGRGVIPYGEHETGGDSHDDNGKGALGALLFGFNGGTNQARFFSRMATAGYNTREWGHTGCYFADLWEPLGANMGGTNAISANLQQYLWFLDMARRPDGSFEYEQSSGSDGSEYYSSFRMTAAYALALATPLRQLYLTGKNQNTNVWLSASEAAEAVAAGIYDASTRTTNQLLSDIASWSPRLRYQGAIELGKRTSDTPSLMPALLAMAQGTDVGARMGACLALGYIVNTNALPVLVCRLNDSDCFVRYLAGGALRNFAQLSRPYLTNMLATLIANEIPDATINWSEPLQFAQVNLGRALFYNQGGSPGNQNGLLGTSLGGVSTNLLYPAIGVVTRLPVGLGRNDCAAAPIGLLSASDMMALAPTVVQATASVTPADRMFDATLRQAGIAALGKYHIEEAVPLAMLMCRWPDKNISGRQVAMNVLTNYGTAAQEVLPELIQLQAQWAGSWDSTIVADSQQAQIAITNITYAQSTPALTYYKQVNAVTANPVVVTLPQTSATVSASVTDFDGDVPLVYTWSKVRGAGNVSFSPNGTTASSTSVATFDTPGNYLLQVSVTDGLINDLVTSLIYDPPFDITQVTVPGGLTDAFGYGGVVSNVTVTVSNGSGFTNQPPLAFPQSVSVAANSTQPIALLGMDPEGYALLYTVASNPIHGILLGDAPNVTYIPAANYYGPDSFSFTVTDSEGAVSPAATIALTVADAPPVASAQYVETTTNTARAITLSGSDNCGLLLTYSVVSGPAQGGLTGTAPNVTYTPNANYIGADSFTFKVNNGLADSPPATVSINVATWQGWTNIAAGNWSTGANWSGSAAPGAGGATNAVLNFNGSTYSGVSANDLSGTFVLNRLNLGSALPALILNGNALSFGSNSSTLPQVNMNSASAVTISNALTLGASTTIGGTGEGGLTLAGLISGAGSLANSSSGILTVGGAGINTFSGGVTASAGTLVLNQSRFNLGTGALNLADGTTFYTANFEGNGSGGAVTNTFNLSGGYVTFPLSFGGTKDDWISGPVTGSGGIIVSGTTRVLTLTASNSFTGGVIFQGGDCGLQLGHTNALGTGVLAAQKTTAGSGALLASADLSGGSGVVNPIDIAPNSYLNVNIANALKLSGPITDSGSLYKAGSATLTLSGTNTYSGSTTVSAGVLKLTSPASLGLYTDLYLPTNSGSLNLAFTGTNCIHGLYLNGVQSPAGVYSSTTPQITGTGYLRVGAVPVAPTSLTALGGAGEVYLSWGASAGAAGYNVKRALASGGPYAAIGSASITTYVDNTATNGTTYYYVVSATNSIGQSVDSTPASAQPLALPEPPGGLTAAATNSWVNLAWAPVSGALGYNVKRSLTNGGAYSVISVIPATNYTDGVVTIGTPYYYVVSAINGAGEGTNSIQASATPIQVASVILTNLAPGNWSAGASWLGGAAPVAGGATTYNLKWNTTPYAGVSFNDLVGAFVLNRMEFGSALPALTNGGNMLQFAANGAIQPLVLQNSTKAVVISNNLTLAASTTVGGTGAGALTLNGVIAGAGSLVKTNSGVLTIGGPSVNTFSGGVTATAGALVLNQSQYNLGSGNATLAGGATFYTTGFEGNSPYGAISNTFNLTGGAVSFPLSFGGTKDLWLTGQIIGNGGISSGGDTRVLTLLAGSTFGGGLTMQDGSCSVQIGSTNALGTGVLTSQKTTVGSGVLETYSDLSASPGVVNPISIPSGCYLNVNIAHNLLLSGPVTNTGSLYKAGTATLILSGANTYSGKTTVSAGVLQLASPASLGTGTDVYLTTSSGSLDLEFTGAAVVHALYINGTKQANGLYGSSTAPITGPGYLLVGPPAAPTGLTAGGAAGQVNLSWAASAGAAGYSVKRSLVSNGTFTPIGSASGTNYTDTAVTAGTWYYYVVAATNVAGASANSAQAAAQPLAPIPPTPVLPVGGVTLSGGVPSFTFTAAAGVKYRLDYKNALADAAWLQGAWSTNSTGGPLSMTLTDSSAVGQPHRFYRLEAAYP